MILSLLGAIALVISERDTTTYAFSGFLFCTCCAIVLLLSRRLAFSVIMTWIFFLGLTFASLIIFSYLSVSLSAFDTFFYITNMQDLTEMSNFFLICLIATIVMITLSIVLGIMIYRSEQPVTFSRIKIFLMLIFTATGVYFTYPPLASNQDYCICTHHCTSCFFASLLNMPEIIGKSQLKKSLDKMPSTAHYQTNITPPTIKDRPDIIVILMESAMQPSLYHEIKAPEILKDSFKSPDGKIHALHVETFGGGTWISTTGVMTSLPTTAFDWLRPYIPVLFSGRIHHSLPQTLKNYGYKTTVISPGTSSFLNEATFLKSLGFENYLDYKAIGAKSIQSNDAFYFNTALKYIEQHHRTDKRPLMLYFMTMGTHWPYNYRSEPSVKLPGEPFGNDDDMNEYLRRLFIERQQLNFFKKRLATNTSPAGAVILEFGDHQPVITLPLATARETSKQLNSFDSIVSTTYYTITPVNRNFAAPLPNNSILDIMYLAPTLLATSGLPLDDVYQDLIAMRDKSATPAEKQLYLKKLVNSKFLQFP